MVEGKVGVKILTQNLWYCNSRKGWSQQHENHDSGTSQELASDWNTRCKAFQQWVAFLEPDVICLQEVLMGDGYDMLTDIFGPEHAPTMSSYKYRAFAKASKWWGNSNVNFGNAIVSKYPIEASHVLNLPQLITPGDAFVETRSALTCILQVPFGNGKLSVTSTHLNYKLHQVGIRMDQVLALTAFVEQHRPQGFPSVIAGDFNATPTEQCIRYMRGETCADSLDRVPANLRPFARESTFWVDAWAVAGNHQQSGHTWSCYNPNTHVDLEENKRLDYIFVSRPNSDGVGLVEEARVVCDHPFAATFPSDHFGVLAEVRIAPGRHPKRAAALQANL